MRKLANTTELQHELHRLLSYAQSERPSRRRLATELRDLSHRLTRVSDRVIGRSATDFATPEALKNYLRDHPHADAKKHHVVKDKGTDQESRSPGAHSVKVKAPKELAQAIKTDRHGSRFDRPGNPVSGVMSRIEKGQDVPLSRIQKAIGVLKMTEEQSSSNSDEKKKLRSWRQKLQEHSKVSD